MGLRTYPDANVIINYFSENRWLAERAWSILGDPTRDFVVSDYLWLEILPKMIYNKQQDQAQYTEWFFGRADYIPASPDIVEKSKELAAAHGLAALDALHAASAIAGGARELLTFERPEKPFFRISAKELLVVSLYA
jgi:predicted nucleic acid-binding protein